MGLQKFRADVASEPDKNGAVAHHASWMGGLTLSKITACPVADGVYEPRTVYATDHPDTMFSIPAACRVRKHTVRGYLTCEDGAWLFHPYKDHIAQVLES